VCSTTVGCLLELPFGLGLIDPFVGVGLVESTAKAVPKGEVLAVVGGVFQVVNVVVTSPVDQSKERHHGEPIMDVNSPNVDKQEQTQVKPVVNGKYQHKQLVGKPLKKSIHGMKGMRRIGCSFDELMMRLVDVRVDRWVVQSTVNPINQTVAESDKEKYRKYEVGYSSL